MFKRFIILILSLFSGKKEEVVHIKKKIELPDEIIFDVDKFNKWFCYEYSGYDGRVGARGIFLRTDKLSPHMISEYFDHLNIESDYNKEQELMDKVRKNWIDRMSRNDYSCSI